MWMEVLKEQVAICSCQTYIFNFRLINNSYSWNKKGWYVEANKFTEIRVWHASNI